MLGTLSDRTDERMNSIYSTIKKTTKSGNAEKRNIKKLTNVNNKLADGLTVSMNVIVDIGKVLKSYNYFMDEVEELVSKLDNQSITSQSVRDLKSITDIALNNLNNNYNEQLDEIVKAYKNNDMDSSRFTKLMNMNDSKGGSNSKTPKTKPNKTKPKPKLTKPKTTKCT